VSLIHGNYAESIPEDVSYLANTARVIEERFLGLIKEAARGEIPLDDFLGELLLLSKDLQRCFRRVMEMKERRDLTFRAIQELEGLDRHCVWLYRRTHVEQSFFRKLHLETKLRNLISADAFSLYQELLDVEDEERAFLAKCDAEIRSLLLMEGIISSSEGL
jgi:hypothetical protein